MHATHRQTGKQIEQPTAKPNQPMMSGGMDLTRRQPQDADQLKPGESNDACSLIDLNPSSEEALNNNRVNTTMQENLDAAWLQEQWPEWGDDNTTPVNHDPLMHGATQREEHRWNMVMNKLNNIENNTNTLTRDVASLSAKVDRQSGDLQQVQTRSLNNEKNIASLSKQHQANMLEFDRTMQEKFKSLENSLREENTKHREELDSALSQESANIKTEVLQETEEKVIEITKPIKDDVLQGQYNFRKINLILVGLHEEKGVDDTSLAKKFFKNKMAITDVELEVAYRLGKQRGTKPRLLLVKFSNLTHRNRVWFAKSKIESGDDARVWIQEDLPKPLKNVHRTLFRVLKKARSLGGRFPNAQIRGQSLLIQGKSFSVDDLETLPEILRPSSMATPQSDSAVVFFGRFSILSNHHLSPFVIGGTQFSCMEQYLAWRRATHSGDADFIRAALTPSDPIVFKGILTNLRKNNPEGWDQLLDQVVTTGLRAKFQQNPSMGRFLCSTHPKEIGEASLNKKWGIGLTLVNPAVLDTSKWAAEGNLLGRKLVQIREELLIEKNN